MEVGIRDPHGWGLDFDDPDTWAYYLMCLDCGEWSLYQGSEETHGQSIFVTRDENNIVIDQTKCSHCGSAMLDQGSVISKGTFHPGRAKAKTKLLLSKKSRRAGH